MILCDAGPLVALLDSSDPHHGSCVAVANQTTPPLVTTWACFAEAMYLVHRAGGHSAQEQLWSLVQDGPLRLEAPDTTELPRIRHLMDKYHDLPMDLADATLVALAEKLDSKTIFTIDKHFRVYLFRDREAFDVVP